jgi:Tfp pilus assembly protein PilX
MREVGRTKGFLLPVLIVSVAVVTLGYLCLSLYSARMEDKVQERRALTAALYAAESGLVLAETKLVGTEQPPPPTGVWLTGELSKSLSRYRVEVSAADYSPESFRLRVIGQKLGERGVVYNVELEASLKRGPDSNWFVEWRRRL